MNISALKPIAETSKPHTGLSDAAREQIARALHGSLEATLSLMLDTQLCHWNVVGPLFKPIHDLTEEHYNNLFEAADEIAERIRALGHPVNIAKHSPTTSNERVSAGARSAVAMIRDLASSHGDIAREYRKAALMADDNRDFVTHELIVQRMAFHEKALWMLSATLADQ